MSDRYPALPTDATGAGEGGGAGGAGGGSWIVVGSGGGTPEEPEPDGPLADTGPYLLDGFADRIVAPPSLADDDVIVPGSLGGRLSVRRGVDIDRVTPFGPLVSAGSMIPRVGSWIGRPPGSYPWTFRPEWSRCRFLDFTFSGWEEIEQWYRLPIPTHPASMAGIRLTVTIADPGGYAAAGAAFDVVVRSGPPTDIRQGAAIGSVAADGAGHVVLIPGSLVPAAGSDLWVGVRAGWQANLASHACGFTLPYSAGASKTDVAGVPHMGHSGRATVNAVAAATWQVSVVGAEGIGQTADPGEAPWGGPFAWRTLGSAGSPAYGVDADGLYAASTAPAAVGFGLDGPVSEDDDEAADEDDEADPGDALPTSDYVGARVDVLWWVDAVGLTDQDGSRALELVVLAEGQRLVARVHVGDTERAPGVSADAGAGLAYQPRTLAPGTRYWLAVDWRSAAFLRAKLWEAGGPLVEPARWDVEVPIGATADTSDRLELWLRVGNVTGSQRLTVRRILAYPAGRPGDTVVGELVGLADGSTATFTAAHPYLPRSIVASAWGLGVRPSAETPQHARYRLDARPPDGTLLRCRYVIAAPDTEP